MHKCGGNGSAQVPKNSNFQFFYFVANLGIGLGKTVFLRVDYACMNYTLTHPAQSRRFKKYVLDAKVPFNLFKTSLLPATQVQKLGYAYY